MINNYDDFKKELNNLSSRPKLLLHACCAPCSSHTMLLLDKYFDITIFFSNDNIYPKEEYDHRLNEILEFIPKLGLKINVLYDDYNDEDFYNAISGLEDLGEKSPRCYSCYKLRMKKTAIKAKELGFDYFTTTLSISPHKVERYINEIGYDLEKEYGIKYLYSNFKKENGYIHSIELSKEYGLYRQDYCGCKYSKNEREDYERSTKEN